ncbi:nuclear transport factor 2 family protein [Tropicimonas sp. IMCC34043]|uniref:nuclear transport factor 2 family protein n=1 Tax=Tropicimonas sp. IMCC34043 TaxID=2248760 RepID=UPI000E251A26|nr:nuclear transport factor 2 family protein [Tropicimonas sp. IMCC34043]
MSIYEKLDAAMSDNNADAFIDLLHEDAEFHRHATGTVLNKAEFSAMMRSMTGSSPTRSQARCIYENDDILVEHSFMDFADGTREAVLVVCTLEDGKIRRIETGATPVSAKAPA